MRELTLRKFQCVRGLAVGFPGFLQHCPPEHIVLTRSHMKPADLKARTHAFSIAIVKFCQTLADSPEARHIRGQLHRAGTSVGSNYRAACRTRSRAEFIAKLGLVSEEADECGYWRDLASETGISPRSAVAPLADEAQQLVRIFVQSQITAKTNTRKGSDRRI